MTRLRSPYTLNIEKWEEWEASDWATEVTSGGFKLL